MVFFETQGFGCGSFGNDESLVVGIDLEGFDTQDAFTSHSFRVKTYMGFGPNCTGMGSDFGQGLRGADLGAYPENKDGTLRVASVKIPGGPTLIGQRSIAGHSVVVLKGTNVTSQKTPPEVLGCCVVGFADLDKLSQGDSSPSTSFTPSTSDQQPSNLKDQGSSGPRQSYPPNTFRSSSDPNSNLPIDLSSKTSRIDSILPSSIQSNFKAPEAPRFQDIFGLQGGESPLGKSGFGSAFGPSPDSNKNKFSDLFFKDTDIRNFKKDATITAEEKKSLKENAADDTSDKGKGRKGSGRRRGDGRSQSSRAANGDNPDNGNYLSSRPSRFGNRSGKSGGQAADSGSSDQSGAADPPPAGQPQAPSAPGGSGTNPPVGNNPGTPNEGASGGSGVNPAPPSVDGGKTGQKRGSEAFSVEKRMEDENPVMNEARGNKS
ncbi:hypothetical protein C0Q70_10863 [Pomacea canaliculata]|uniref:Uncharacterized protein n=1 Tax=Pomacea canaliculata TaxID=400727 RepID=A0A2T7P4E0_POMCA|nr:hypothetical protein C0Q70_10863 [Pomacea canaliculata]